MWQRLKWRLSNLGNEFKHYVLLFFTLEILLAPYLLNNVLLQAEGMGEKVYRGVMFSLLLLLVSEFLTKVLFKIHFKVIDNIKTDKSYVEKLCKRIATFIFVLVAGGFYLLLGFSPEKELIDGFSVFIVLLAFINSFLRNQILVGDSYLAYNLQTVKLENINSYQIEYPKWGGKKVRLLLENDDSVVEMRTNTFQNIKSSLEERLEEGY